VGMQRVRMTDFGSVACSATKRPRTSSAAETTAKVPQNAAQCELLATCKPPTQACKWVDSGSSDLAICKQEVAGWIPAGSTRRNPVHNRVSHSSGNGGRARG
jgi:hypothetical protein